MLQYLKKKIVSQITKIDGVIVIVRQKNHLVYKCNININTLNLVIKVYLKKKKLPYCYSMYNDFFIVKYNS